MSELSWENSEERASLQKTGVSSANTHPVTIQRKRRKSSFNTADSPYAIGKSFLSKSMLEDDNFQSYELSSYSSYSDRNCGPEFSRIPSYSINLTKSQGFIWNQDLFVTSFQQRRAGLTPSSVESTPEPVKVIDIIVDSDEEEEDVEKRRSKNVSPRVFGRYNLRKTDDTHCRSDERSATISEKNMEAEEDTYFPGDSQACGGDW